MSQIILSAETEEIVDRPNFSLFALIAVLLSLIGCFSLRYLQAMPFAILGGALGAFCLFTAKRKQLGIGSKLLALIATGLGMTIASTGYFSRQLTQESNVTEARKIAEDYLNSVYQGDMSRVYFLSGRTSTDLASASPEMKEELKGIQSDPIAADIRGRKQAPKWELAGLLGDVSVEGAQVLRLHYRDAALPKKPSCCVVVRKAVQKPNPEKKPAIWTIDRFEEIQPK